MRALVAEDDRVARRSLEVNLGRWGFDVSAASDGRHAWDVLRSEDAPPWAAVDWMMPGMDGVEVCRRARRLYWGAC